MNFKSLAVTLLSLVVTTGLLYFIGHLFSVPWFMFHYQSSFTPDGFVISSGSFVPVIIGLAVSFFAERLCMKKCHSKLG